MDAGINPNVRRSGESQKQYRERLREEKNASKSLVVRVLWASQWDGTAIRTADGYARKPLVKVQKRRLTEAEDNARGRAIRRRSNRHLRGWLPYAQR